VICDKPFLVFPDERCAEQEAVMNRINRNIITGDRHLQGAVIICREEKVIK
jgi:hypothetical protein